MAASACNPIIRELANKFEKDLLRSVGSIVQNDRSHERDRMVSEELRITISLVVEVSNDLFTSPRTTKKLHRMRTDSYQLETEIKVYHGDSPGHVYMPLSELVPYLNQPLCKARYLELAQYVHDKCQNSKLWTVNTSSDLQGMNGRWLNIQNSTGTKTSPEVSDKRRGILEKELRDFLGRQKKG